MAAPDTSAGPTDVVLTETLREADEAAFAAFVDSAKDGHYSQTVPWSRVTVAAKSVRPLYFLERGALGEVLSAGVVLQPHLRGLRFPVAWLERGPVCASPSRLSSALGSLTRATRSRGILRVGVMPYWVGPIRAEANEQLRLSRFRDVQEFGGSHVVTLRLDLRKPDTELFAGREHQTLRRELRRAERAGVEARLGTTADVPHLKVLHDELARSQGMKGKPAAWYDALAEHIVQEGSRGGLFVCDHEGQPVSVIFVSRHGEVATFVHGASSTRQIGVPKMGPGLMLAVRWAREQGCTVFDMGGVPMDGDTDPKRANIARFKFTFARERVSLVHEYARWF